MTTATDSFRPMLEAYFAQLDSRDVDGAIGSNFTEDAKVRFANADPVFGHDAIQGSIGAVVNQTSSIKHDIPTYWEEPGPGENTTLLYELMITYNLKTGKTLVLPGMSLAIVNPDGKIVEQRLYGDLNEVFAG
jgi:SnoaL-like domain